MCGKKVNSKPNDDANYTEQYLQEDDEFVTLLNSQVNYYSKMIDDVIATLNEKNQKNIKNEKTDIINH